MINLDAIPIANRLHISFFGRCNSGKSSLINAFTRQDSSIVADLPGTTTDPVYKPMEIVGIGPVVLIDTAGIDDQSILGIKRLQRTKLIEAKTDIAIILLERGDNLELELWTKFKGTGIPVIPVINKVDLGRQNLISKITSLLGENPLLMSAKTGKGISALRSMLVDLAKLYVEPTLLENLIKPGMNVCLVMPQDLQAPKGRLISPQVQVIRALLDQNCVITCVTTGQLAKFNNLTKQPFDWIITDSQVFREVAALKSPASKLTSFSILFAAFKGDLPYYLANLSYLEKLKSGDNILIAECCTHTPLHEDIGRVKIPKMLDSYLSCNLTYRVLAGDDFPQDLSLYRLIVQCGGCAFNRRYVMHRIMQAKQQKVPMTNYGVLLAFLQGTLGDIRC